MFSSCFSLLEFMVLQLELPDCIAYLEITASSLLVVISFPLLLPLMILIPLSHLVEIVTCVMQKLLHHVSRSYFVSLYSHDN